MGSTGRKTTYRLPVFCTQTATLAFALNEESAQKIPPFDPSGDLEVKLAWTWLTNPSLCRAFVQSWSFISCGVRLKFHPNLHSSARYSLSVISATVNTWILSPPTAGEINGSRFDSSAWVSQSAVPACCVYHSRLILERQKRRVEECGDKLTACTPRLDICVRLALQCAQIFALQSKYVNKDGLGSIVGSELRSRGFLLT